MKFCVRLWANTDRPHHKVMVEPQHVSVINTGPQFALIPLFPPKVWLFPVFNTLLCLVFCFFFLSLHLLYTNKLSRFSTLVPSYVFASCSSFFFFFSFFPNPSHTFSAFSPPSVSHSPARYTVATALTFSPVGPCVCCNELYLIADWDLQP